MKIKHLVPLIFIFVLYVPSVYSQLNLDITQLEALQQLQQEEQDIDDPAEPYKNNGPLDNKALTDDQASTTEAADDFGYQGRNDFLLRQALNSQINP